MIYEISGKEFVRVAQIALEHHENKTKDGARELKHNDNLTGYELHLIGLLGELAVAKATGGKVQTKVLEGSDGGVDMIVNGEPVQIKTFRYTGKNRQFYIDDMSRFTCQTCYCCRCHSFCRVEVVGTIDRDVFKSLATEKNYGYGVRLCVPDSALRPLDLP